MLVVSVYRYNPEKDSAPYMQDFNIDTKGADLMVNPTKGKQLTNMRASGTDENIKIVPILAKELEFIVKTESREQIIIIDDGSTDTTKSILQNYPHLQVLSLLENKGKGNALNLGFQKALDMGYDYAITIDSDGQHFPKDISDFLRYFEKEQFMDSDEKTNNDTNVG